MVALLLLLSAIAAVQLSAAISIQEWFISLPPTMPLMLFSGARPLDIAPLTVPEIPLPLLWPAALPAPRPVLLPKLFRPVMSPLGMMLRVMLEPLLIPAMSLSLSSLLVACRICADGLAFTVVG